MRLSTHWTCPECGERIPVHLDAANGITGNRAHLRVKVPPTALADAFAHAWTHREVA